MRTTFSVPLTVLIAALALGAPGGVATAQSPQDFARQATERGTAFSKRKDYASAVREFTAAINSGALPPPALAQALLSRGIAQRQSNQPASAISDFNSALFIKGGLTKEGRSQAESQRAAAYREAGVMSAPAAAVAAAAPAVAPKASAPTSPVAAKPPQNLRPATVVAAPVRAVPPRPAEPARPVVVKHPPAPQWGTPQVTAAATPPRPSAPSPAAAPPATNPVTAFLSNLFAGASTGTGPISEQPTGAIARTQPPTNQKPTSVSSWQSTTRTAKADEPRQSSAGPASTGTSAQAASRAAAQPPPAQQVSTQPLLAALPTAPEKPRAIQTRKPSGYDLQVVSLRSRDRADAILRQIEVEFGNDLGGRSPRVVERVLGNMGTFYSVRIGPYTSGDPPEVCTQLKSRGFDCLMQPKE